MAVRFESARDFGLFHGRKLCCYMYMCSLQNIGDSTQVPAHANEIMHDEHVRSSSTSKDGKVIVITLCWYIIKPIGNQKNSQGTMIFTEVLE